MVRYINPTSGEIQSTQIEDTKGEVSLMVTNSDYTGVTNLVFYLESYSNCEQVFSLPMKTEEGYKFTVKGGIDNLVNDLNSFDKYLFKIKDIEVE